MNVSKLGGFRLYSYRQLPEDADINEVILAKQKAGNWAVSIVGGAILNI
ncbi:MAG: hypothetical protein J07HQX50_02218 [Haloquadratum sp. J07HQX50]|nr:MAG: hypothetical protein J07HQX50_02218 [Haloquadratum sp. J07HQX50]